MSTPEPRIIFAGFLLLLLTQHSCSLACSKNHREEHPPEEEKPPAPAPAEKPADGGGDSSSAQPDEFNKIFAKYPNLASYLHQIADETEPPPPNLTSGPDGGGGSGFRRRQQQQQRKPWTREVGMQNGLHKLRQLRDRDTSGALQEFCDLVHVLNAQKADEEARQLAAQRDAEAIAQMIRDEREKAR